RTLKSYGKTLQALRKEEANGSALLQSSQEDLERWGIRRKISLVDETEDLETDVVFNEGIRRCRLPVIPELAKLFSDFTCFICFHKKIKPLCTTTIANIQQEDTIRSNISDFMEYLRNRDVWYLIRNGNTIHAVMVMERSQRMQDRYVQSSRRCEDRVFALALGRDSSIHLEKAPDFSQQAQLEDAISENDERLFQF
ncbi:10635_t:CDS:2, partial [Ambispora leptoticha]